MYSLSVDINLRHDTLFTLLDGGPACTLGGSCVGTFLNALWYFSRKACTAHFTGEEIFSAGDTNPMAANFLARRLDARLPALRRLLRPFFVTSLFTSLLTISKAMTRHNKMALTKKKLT